MVLSSAGALEKVGERGFSTFAGVIMAEATKQIYAAQAEAKVKRRRAYLHLAQRTPPASTHGFR